MRKPKIPYERLKQILYKYISHDAEHVELCCVRDYLQHICGCSHEEIIELGFGYLLDIDDSTKN